MSVRNSVKTAKEDLSGFVKETTFSEDNKLFDLFHNPKTGQYKRVEA